MIILNDIKIKNPITISNLIKKYKIPNEACIIINGKIIKKTKWLKIKLKDGDKVEIVGFVGGG